MNYDVAGTQTGLGTSTSGALDLRIFSPVGIVSLGLLTYTGTTPQRLIGVPGVSSANRVLRLDTGYTYADLRTLRRYSVGDFITGGLSWTRPVRMGGLQVRSDFSMRPDLITFPLPPLADRLQCLPPWTFYQMAAKCF